MTKARTSMLICITSLFLILTIAIMPACVPFSEGITTAGDETRLPAGTGDDIDKTESSEDPVTETDTSFAAGTETDDVTEEDPPPEVTISAGESSVLLEEGESRKLTLTVSPEDIVDESLITAVTSDTVIAKVSLSTEDDVHVLTVTAVGEGEAVADVLYDGVPVASIAVIVTKKVVDPKPLPQVKMSDEIDPSLPMLALTFDDGPGSYTSELLDILEKYNVHATFFVLGNMLGTDARKNVLKRAIADGHEIGIHTWDHTKLTKLGREDIRTEITSVRDLLERIAGYTPRLMRPPGGSTNDDVRSVCAEEGFIVVRWSVDTEDWKTRNSEATYKVIMNQAKDGAIILCHDIHKTTVAAMDETIAALLNEGYQLVTVSELLSFGKTAPAAGDVVNSRK